jgi:hypothetical protein
MMSRAGQIMISHLNGSFRAIADRRAQIRFAHVFAHNKRADRTNINDPEVLQLFRDRRRLTSICPADVHRAKKYDTGHASVCTDEWRVTNDY